MRPPVGRSVLPATDQTTHNGGPLLVYPALASGLSPAACSPYSKRGGSVGEALLALQIIGGPQLSTSCLPGYVVLPLCNRDSSRRLIATPVTSPAGRAATIDVARTRLTGVWRRRSGVRRIRLAGRGCARLRRYAAAIWAARDSALRLVRAACAATAGATAAPRRWRGLIAGRFPHDNPVA